jgi:hypothetical protein
MRMLGEEPAPAAEPELAPVEPRLAVTTPLALTRQLGEPEPESEPSVSPPEKWNVDHELFDASRWADEDHKASAGNTSSNDGDTEYFKKRSAQQQRKVSGAEARTEFYESNVSFTGLAQIARLGRAF